MNLQSTQHTPISSAISSAFATVEPRPVFLTVDQFQRAQPGIHVTDAPESHFQGRGAPILEGQDPW